MAPSLLPLPLQRVFETQAPLPPLDDCSAGSGCTLLGRTSKAGYIGMEKAEQLVAGSINSSMTKSVVVLGAGHAGCTIALLLAEHNIDVMLVEVGREISQGPVCHLHAFGAIYPDMEDTSELPEMAISFARSFPEAIDRRPTVVSLSPTSTYSPAQWHAKIQQSGAAYAKLLSGLKRSQRQVLIPDGAPVVEVLRSSCGSPVHLSAYGIQAARWLPDDAKDAVLVWECGLNDVRLAGTFELALKQSTRIELLLDTKAVSMTPAASSDGWVLELQHCVDGTGAAGTQRLAAKTIIDARGARINPEIAPAAAEFKAVFRASHPMPSNVPEIIILDKRGTPGLCQYTPARFGSKLHKMQVGASLFGCILHSPQESDHKRMEELARDPERSRAAYELARGLLKPGTLPATHEIFCLPPMARFQRLPREGGTESRSSYAVEAKPGFIEVTLSKSTSVVSVATSVLALLRQRLSKTADIEPTGQAPVLPVLQTTSKLQPHEVDNAALSVARRRCLPELAASKYDWDELSCEI